MFVLYVRNIFEVVSFDPFTNGEPKPSSERKQRLFSKYDWKLPNNERTPGAFCVSSVFFWPIQLRFCQSAFLDKIHRNKAFDCDNVLFPKTKIYS